MAAVECDQKMLQDVSWWKYIWSYIFWLRKPSEALCQKESQEPFIFLFFFFPNANSSTFPCCSGGKSCSPTAHAACWLREPERQAIGCNPAATRISILQMLPHQCITVTKASRGTGVSAPLFAAENDGDCHFFFLRKDCWIVVAYTGSRMLLCLKRIQAKKRFVQWPPQAHWNLVLCWCF